MHDIKVLLAMAMNQPDPNPSRDFESALGLAPWPHRSTIAQ
jgi:hypothetical protein